LLDYFNIVDDRIDARPDVTSKHPQWGVDHWPQLIVERILDQILDKTYSVEEVIFNQSKISFGVHADSGSLNQRIYKAILIPLEITNGSGTVFFDNHWPYASAKFTRQKFDPMIYTVFDSNDDPVRINLLEFLLDRDINKFPNYTDEYISNLISTRKNSTGYSKTDIRINDYDKIIGYNPNQNFDQDIHRQYINHVDINDLTGLSLDKIIPWVLGNVIVFDRTQLHCATSGHKSKTGITIFTNLV